MQFLGRDIGADSCFLTKVMCTNQIDYQESVASFLIQATGTVEFEDCLRTGVLPGGCWCPCGDHTYPRINAKLPLGSKLLLGVV